MTHPFNDPDFDELSMVEKQAALIGALMGTANDQLRVNGFQPLAEYASYLVLSIEAERCRQYLVEEGFVAEEQTGLARDLAHDLLYELRLNRAVQMELASGGEWTSDHQDEFDHYFHEDFSYLALNDEEAE